MPFCNVSNEFSTCFHKVSVRIFEHNFVEDKAKICRNTRRIARFFNAVNGKIRQKDVCCILWRQVPKGGECIKSETTIAALYFWLGNLLNYICIALALYPTGVEKKYLFILRKISLCPFQDIFMKFLVVDTRSKTNHVIIRTVGYSCVRDINL